MSWHICRRVYVLAWSLCLWCHCWCDSWIFSPSSTPQKAGHGAVGKKAGILLVLPRVQLKARPEPSLSLMCLSDSENFLAIAFFPVSNNPFVFTHFLPEMSCFLFAWQISLWTSREGDLCTFFWGLFHPSLPALSIWNGFWLLQSSLVLALAPPSALSSSAHGERSSTLGGFASHWHSMEQPHSSGGMDQELPPNCQIIVQHRTESAAKFVFSQRIRKDWVFCAPSLHSRGCDLELEVKLPVYFCSHASFTARTAV